MDALHLDAVAARVVAWHNKHPLARRITAAQVHTMGYVALPFVVPGGGAPPLAGASTAPGRPAAQGVVDAPQGGSLRERALARMRQQQANGASRSGADADPAASAGADGAADAAAAAAAGSNPRSQAPGVATASASGSDPRRAASAAGRSAIRRLWDALTRRSAPPLRGTFAEDFIPPLAPRRVARWAAGQGRPLAQPPNDAPLRRVEPEGAAPGTPLTLYVLTAAADAGGARTRVLLGAGAPAQVLGRRLWSVPRSAAALLAPLLLVAGAVATTRLQTAATAPVQAVAAGAQGAASASASASASDSASASASASHPAAVAAAAMPSAGEGHANADGGHHGAAGQQQGASAVAGGNGTADIYAAAAPHAAAASAGPDTAAPAASAAAIAPPPASTASTASAADSTQRPPDVEPRLGVIDLPRLGRITAAERHAAARADGRAAPAARVPQHAPQQAPDAAPAAAAASVAAATTVATAELPSPPTAPLPRPTPKRQPLQPKAVIAAAARAAADAQAAAPPAAAGTPAADAPAPPAPAPAGRAAAPPAAVATAAAQPAVAARAGNGAYAVSTRPLRTRAEAEQVLAAMGALLRDGGAAGGVQVEIVAQGADWRVVGWPYRREGDADGARALLAARGLRVAVVAF